jgi:hypothetical protein
MTKQKLIEEMKNKGTFAYDSQGNNVLMLKLNQVETFDFSFIRGFENLVVAQDNYNGWNLRVLDLQGRFVATLPIAEGQ